MRFSEEQLTRWTKPLGNTEEGRLENSIRMVKEAIDEDEKLGNMEIEKFLQGSYANDTNIRNDSDVDMNIMYKEGFLYDLPSGITEENFGIKKSSSGYGFREFKNDVENALINKFGRSEVKRKNKCINIKENSYKGITDVVPTFEYRRYRKDKSYVIGTAFFPNDSTSKVVNFPKQHIENGKVKNYSTRMLFKKLTRIHKNLHNEMIRDKEITNDNIASFLLESLVFNVPNEIMNNYDNWTKRLRESILFIFDQTEKKEPEKAELCEEWGEVSELLYLFRGRKWSIEDVNLYMVQLYSYLGF